MDIQTEAEHAAGNTGVNQGRAGYGLSCGCMVRISVSGHELTLGARRMRKEGTEKQCNTANKIIITSLHLNMSECKT